jgi:hypothetical protein
MLERRGVGADAGGGTPGDQDILALELQIHFSPHLGVQTACRALNLLE